MNIRSAMYRPTLSLFFLLLASSASSFDITSILSQFSDFSVFNGYLSQTNLVFAINSRSTITILAVSNDGMSALSGLPLDAIQRVLSLHVILDYYDEQKLHHLSHKTTHLTTLFQTTGTATGEAGFLNVTVLSSGTVAFGSAMQGASLSANLVKSITSQPYDVSVLQISSVIFPPGFNDGSSSIPPVNITSALVNSGFRAFAELLQSTGAIQTFQNSAKSGVTIFAPKDQAITKLATNLTSDQKVSLALYHAVAGYLPSQYLKKVAAPLGTLASNGNSNFQLKVQPNGENIALNTGVNTVTIVKTVLDQQQVVLYSIDNALKAPEIFSPGTHLAFPPLTPPAAATPSPDPFAVSPPAPPSDDAESPAPSDIAPGASSPADGPVADASASAPAAEVPPPSSPNDKEKDTSSAVRLAYSFCLGVTLGMLYL
ncbi:Fasciclin-like arabinogalactan protein 8 [Nymphaea thermarum]|nr:Fasciclin-like arabinogalactan protein 8 [Nymphaea thermarum]